MEQGTIFTAFYLLTHRPLFDVLKPTKMVHSVKVALPTYTAFMYVLFAVRRHTNVVTLLQSKTAYFMQCRPDLKCKELSKAVSDMA